MEYISIPSFSILVNGIPREHFGPKSAIRQGDPIPP